MCDVRVFAPSVGDVTSSASAPPAPGFHDLPARLQVTPAGTNAAPRTAAQVLAQFRDEGCTCGFCLPSLPRVVYINLDRRVDRAAPVERRLHDAFLTAERFAGFDAAAPENAAAVEGCGEYAQCRGQVGCQRSHVGVLQAAIDKGWGSVMVLEDDFAFRPAVDKQLVPYLLAAPLHAMGRWDVFGVSLNLIDYDAVTSPPALLAGRVTYKIQQIRDAQTTGGYIVNRHYMEAVRRAFADCPVATGGYDASIDFCWKHLQPDAGWFTLRPQLGRQTASVSDIEMEAVDYSTMPGMS
jgi:hypothetical protein